ncbi:elongation factor G, partial [mine drainage metagenome]
YVVRDIPQDLAEIAQSYREKLVESVVEHDESLTEKYLSGEEITNDELIEGLRKITVSMKGTPILCGAAFKIKESNFF